MLNLYNILLESIDCNRLIEEGKDPREVLHYKFQYVPSAIIDGIIAIDPTKKKSYSQWVLSKWNDESDVINSALDNGRLEKLFNFFKEHQEKQIKDCPSVKEGLDAYVKEEDSVLDKSSDEETYVLMLGGYVPSENANDFDIIFNKDNWLIAVPNTYEAACKLGENCWWCTSNHYGNGKYYYDTYLEKGGKYYINFDLSESETLDDKTVKTYPYKRYQFHFESNQFKSAAEGEPDVTVEDMNIPQSALDFYREIDERYEVGTMDEERMIERYEQLRAENNIYIDNGLYLNISYDDDEFRRVVPQEGDEFRLYTSDDVRDPINVFTFDPNVENIIVDKGRGWYLLRSREGVIVYVGDEVNGDRAWDAISLKSYAVSEEDKGIIYGIEVGGEFIMLQDGAEVDNLSIRDYDSGSKVFINSQLNQYKDESTLDFIEIDDGSYHSLVVAHSDSLYILIYNDTPSNGEYFTIEEDGLIHGEMKSYELDDYLKADDAFYDDDQYYYHYVERLSDGNFLVLSYKHGGSEYGYVPREEYAILDAKSKELITPWFKEYIGMIPEANGYLVKQDKFHKQVYTKDGKALTDGSYDNIQTLDGRTILATVIKRHSLANKCTLIDIPSGKEFIHFDYFDENVFDGCAKVRDEDAHNRIYDYVNRRYKYEGYVSTTPLYNGCDIYIMVREDGLYDFVNIKENEMLANGCETESYGNKIIVTNGERKKNVLMRKGFILPKWFDNIEPLNSYFFLCYEGNVKFLFDDSGDQYLNPNGFLCDVKPINSEGVEFTNGEISVVYLLNNERFSIYWLYGDRNSAKSFDRNSPIEVQQFVNSLRGVKTESKNQYDVLTEFQRISNLIEDIRKRNLY